jgi:hypothetical protein
MNIFGTFTFGSLIKTFLPGLVWLVAILMLDVDVAEWRGAEVEPPFWNFVKNSDQTALVLAIPAALLVGLLSNVVVFMGVNDRLVRSPTKKAHPELWRLYDELSQRIRERCWSALDGIDENLKTAFSTHIDPELVLLRPVGVEQLAYVREQYWFHLEFQLNLLLSAWAMAVALGDSSLLHAGSWPMKGVYVLLVFVGAALVTGGLLTAARKNYMRHIAKMASLMAAVLCPEKMWKTSAS